MHFLLIFNTAIFPLGFPSFQICLPVCITACPWCSRTSLCPIPLPSVYTNRHKEKVSI